jgi:tetratricopeptide (TPR) repeat protein
MDEDDIRNIDDLAVATELYHTLIELNRAKDAYDILEDRIIDPVGDRIGAFHELAELIEMFLAKPSLMERLKDEDDEDTWWLIAILGICYCLCGDPVRALEAFDKLDRRFMGGDYSGVYAFRSMILCQKGALAEAERSAWEAINESSKEDSPMYSYPLLALAAVLIERGEYEKSRAWLCDYRIQIENPEDIDQPLYAALFLSKCELAALRQNDLAGIQMFAQKMATIAEQSELAQVRIYAIAFSADVAEAQGEHDEAHRLLNDALVLARETRLTDNEANLLVRLGRWNIDQGRLDAARACATDALHIAEHAKLGLRQVDALNLLSEVQCAFGNQHESASAAAQAYCLAWCDGQPFAYEWGIRQARENLAAQGEQEPANLPAYSPSSELPEQGIVPTSLIDALTQQPPLDEAIIMKVIRHLPVNDESSASLRALIRSTSSSQVRLAAISTLEKLYEDSD